MKNYYDEILEKIKLKIDEKNFREAWNLIGEELSAPYIPLKFEKELKKLDKLVFENMKLESTQNNKVWDLQKITKILAKKGDPLEHLMAIEALKGLNARKIMNEIKKYFLDKKMEHMNKVFLFFILIDQAVDEEVTIYKKDQKYVINPVSFDVKGCQKILKKIENKIENIIYNSNPSLFEICKDIASAHFYSHFLDLNFKDTPINDVCAAVILKAYDAMGMELDFQLEKKISFNRENTMLLLNELEEIV